MYYNKYICADMSTDEPLPSNEDNRHHHHHNSSQENNHKQEDEDYNMDFHSCPFMNYLPIMSNKKSSNKNSFYPMMNPAGVQNMCPFYAMFQNMNNFQMQQDYDCPTCGNRDSYDDDTYYYDDFDSFYNDDFIDTDYISEPLYDDEEYRHHHKRRRRRRPICPYYPHCKSMCCHHR